MSTIQLAARQNTTRTHRTVTVDPKPGMIIDLIANAPKGRERFREPWAQSG